MAAGSGNTGKTVGITESRRRRAPTQCLPDRKGFIGDRTMLMRFSSLVRAAITASAILAGASTAAWAQRSAVAPEAASGRHVKPLATAQSHMVSAANPLAVEAGLDILAAGGSAVDAAIAVQLVLNLVEPQSSGLGGGAFVLHWDAAARLLKTYDGRETAPAAAKPDRFISDGKPIAFERAVHSGLSIGVPGTPRLLEVMHREHGRLPWARLFDASLRLAERGFPVPARLHTLLAGMGADKFSPAARSYFFDSEGRPRPIGYNLTNPAFATTLQAMRASGADGFYEGKVAAQLIEAAATAPFRAGDITPADLAAYRVATREPLCVPYRGYRICGMAPPSSGGIAVAQTLQLIGGMDLGRSPGAAMGGAALHVIAEAEKLAFADRDLYVGDPDFTRLPKGLLNSNYLSERAKLINPRAAMPRPKAGVPPGTSAGYFGVDASIESVGTSHISIVDRNGNAVSMTTTIEAGFGSRVMAAGFLLNNELTDFSFRPVDAQGLPLANAVAPGKRPRSSMAPTIVFAPDGKLFAVLGSPGGSRIILYVVKALVGLIDWQLDAQVATELPNFGSRGAGFELEFDPILSAGALLRPWQGRSTVWYALQMKPYGHRIVPDVMTSGLHIVRVRDGRLEGGADPRREGVARGE